MGHQGALLIAYRSENMRPNDDDSDYCFYFLLFMNKFFLFLIFAWMYKLIHIIYIGSIKIANFLYTYINDDDDDFYRKIWKNYTYF